MHSHRSLFSALLFLLVIFWTGCGESPTTGGTTDTTGKVQGRVVSSADPGAGISGATVRIEGTDHTAVTSSDGSFSFEDVADGDVTIIVEAPAGGGYESSEIEVSVYGGGTVDLDVSILPHDYLPERMQLYPTEVRIGILDEARFWVNIWADWLGADGQGPGSTDNGGESDFVPPHGNDGEIGTENKDYPYLRPTWSIKSNTPIGVISREGTFIGTAVGRGTIVATFSTDLVATAEIEVVSDGEVVSVQIAPGYFMTIQGGADQYMGAYAISGAGTLIDDPVIDWSLDPEALGVLEPVTGLTEEEEAEIVRSLPFYGDYYGYGFPIGPIDPAWYPDVSREELIGKISLAKFTAAEPSDEQSSGMIRAALGNVAAATEVQVVRRGILDRAFLSPDEIHVQAGAQIFFSAAGLNEFDYSLTGLAFEWRMEPAGFGVFSEIDFPNGPGGTDDGFPPHDDGMGEGHQDGEMGMGGDEPIGPSTGAGEFRLFSPEQTGEGEIIVTVTDPLSNRSIEARARVFVEAAPRLIDVIVEPERVEIERGQEIPLHAFAIADNGDVVIGVKFDWIVSPDLGEFYDGPHEPEFDSTLTGDGETGDGSDDPGGPGEDGMGFSMRLFRAADATGEGSIIVEAYTEDGVAVRREVPVFIR